MKLFFTILFVCFSIFSVNISFSAKPVTKNKLFDPDQPITLKSKHILVNQKNGSITYKGNVQIKQGDLLIKAEKATTKTVGNQPSQVWARGNPVKVQSRRNGNLMTITAAGAHYNVKSGMIMLTGNVKLLMGKDSMGSKQLMYNVKTNKILVNTKNAPLNASFDSEHIKELHK